MCGIVGIYNFKRTPLREDYVRWCLGTMRHRGPDAEGIWHNNQNYIAGFARLAIRDLSENGHQPMLSVCGNYCISFNGEIYNTGELKTHLLPYHRAFKSTTDTEVLMYALIHLGIKKTLQVADGIFAFAFYSLKEDTLILARDRMGVKPLYIGVCNDGVVYSSQYDHIINHPYFQSAGLNEKAIGAFLCLGYIPEDHAALHNTKLLLHGHYYRVQKGEIIPFEYYDYLVDTDINANDRCNIDEVIQKSVASQLISDVPLGTFMSGGVDSTLVTYFANRERGMNSFTIGVKNSTADESVAAAKYAAIFKTNHLLKFIEEKDLETLILENIKAFSEPFADISSLPLLLLSKFAKEKVTVALSGDGGDELFWGYPRNRKALYLLRHYKFPPALRRVSMVAAKLKDRLAIDMARHWDEEDFLSYYYHSLFIAGTSMIISDIFNIVPVEDKHYLGIKKEFTDFENDTKKAMAIVRKLEMDIHLQRILLKVDRASMYHSLEVRVPLLSNAMLDHSRAYSYTDCIKGGQGKLILKNSLINKTGTNAALQPKKGFIIPIDEWIRHTIKKDVIEKILNMPAHLSILFRKHSLEKLLDGHLSGKSDNGWLLWAIYSLVNWDNFHCKKIKK